MVNSYAYAQNIMACQLGLIMTSFHEAGHTICGLLQGFKIEKVWVEHDVVAQVIEGFTAYDDTPRSNIRWLRSELRVSYAGMVAEDILFQSLFGSPIPNALKGDSSDDTISARCLMKTFNIGKPGKERSRLKQKIIKQTTDLLTKHWEDIIIVAHALIQKQRMQFSELKRLLLRKSKKKVFWKEQFKKISPSQP